MTELGGSFNDLEVRLARLEQNAMVPISGLADVYLDGGGGTVVDDQLDWTAAAGAWESYTTVGPIITDASNANYPGGDLSGPYGKPEVHRAGSMCVLTGLVRRRLTTLATGARHNVPMFGLPESWRPNSIIPLPCLMGGTDPAGLAVVGTAWIEIRPDLAQPSGRAYFVTGTVACTKDTGWIALQGIFPCSIADTGANSVVENSWDDAHFQTTWDSIDPSITWNNYTSVE